MNTVKAGLTNLRLNGPTGDGTLHTLNQMSYLRILVLNSTIIKGNDWNHISLPNGISNLTINRCRISDDFMDLNIENCKNLEDMVIMNEPNLTQKSFDAIGKAVKLKRLVLSFIGSPDLKFNVTSIASSKDLERLYLAKVGIMEESLPKLWEGLTTLRTLDLHKLDITDEGLDQLHLLQNLTELGVKDCPNITGNYIVNFVCGLSSLKFLRFDVKLFLDHTDDPDELRKIISPLNQVSSLTNIKISLCEEDRPGSFSQVLIALCWGKKKVWTITTESRTEVVLHR